MNICNKLRQRISSFRKHPITKDQVARAVKRYILFNSFNRVKKEVSYNWIGDLKFLARKGDAGLVANIYFGLYEFSESVFLLHFLREEDIFIDIGANLGHYSLLASGIKKCRTIAVEPVPDVFVQLNRQIELNGLSKKITLMNIGISDSAGTLFFSINRGTMNRVVNSGYPDAAAIAVKTLDEISANIAVDLIKIDVEGYEKFVLNGGTKTIKNKAVKAIIIEINDSNKHYGIKNEEISQFLAHQDFHPFRYNPMKRELTRLQGYNKEQFNTIFVRDLAFVQKRLEQSEPIRVWDKKI